MGRKIVDQFPPDYYPLAYEIDERIQPFNFEGKRLVFL